MDSDYIVKKAQLAIDNLDKRLSVLQQVSKDLETQFIKLRSEVPEDDIDMNAEKEGYVAYGSYANIIIARRTYIKRSLDSIQEQIESLFEEKRAITNAMRK